MQTHTEERKHIKVKLLDGATMPTRAHADDVGYDVTIYDADIKTCDDIDERDPLVDCIVIDTGVAIEPPAGYHVEVVPNSRICKSGFIMPNTPGIIDPGYRGTIKIVLRPIIPITFDDADDLLPNGKVCGQLIIRKTEHMPFIQADELSETERGTGGFGSTENKR